MLLLLPSQEVVQNTDGTRTLLAHEPAATLYPSGSAAGQLLQAAQMCSLDSLQLEDQQQQQPQGRGAAAAAAAAAGGGGGEDGDGDDAAGGNMLRHLTPAQRASMSVRTFNLR